MLQRNNQPLIKSRLCVEVEHEADTNIEYIMERIFDAIQWIEGTGRMEVWRDLKTNSLNEQDKPTNI